MSFDSLLCRLKHGEITQSNIPTPSFSAHADVIAEEGEEEGSQGQSSSQSTSNQVGINPVAKWYHRSEGEM